MTQSKNVAAAKPAITKKSVAPKAVKTAPASTKAPATVPKIAGKSKQIAKAAKVKPPTEAVKPVKATKPKKMKLVRDSFTMPSFDYALIDTLKLNALKGKVVLKKSEVLRAGLHALAKLGSEQLIALVGTLAIIKTGRPKK